MFDSEKLEILKRANEKLNICEDLSLEKNRNTLKKNQLL